MDEELGLHAVRAERIQMKPFITIIARSPSRTIMRTLSHETSSFLFPERLDGAAPPTAFTFCQDLFRPQWLKKLPTNTPTTAMCSTRINFVFPWSSSSRKANRWETDEPR